MELIDIIYTIRHWFAPYYLASKNTEGWSKEYKRFVAEKRRKWN